MLVFAAEEEEQQYYEPLLDLDPSIPVMVMGVGALLALITGVAWLADNRWEKKVTASMLTIATILVVFGMILAALSNSSVPISS